MILGLCDRFGWTPDEARSAPADVMRMIQLVDYAKGVTGDG